MIKNIVFDFGNVLVCWNPAIVYQDYFSTTQERDFFVQNVISRDWHNRIDIGIPFDQCIKELKSAYPQYAEPIELYKRKWDDMLTGEMPGMFQLVSQVKSLPNIHVYGLTNWSMETYPQARKRFPILQLIDDYVVSGDIHLIKPDPKIYEFLIHKYNLNVHETLFIDDNPSNVSAAEQLGIQAHLFTSSDNLKAFLIEQNILSE